MAASSTLSVPQFTNSILNLPSLPMPGPNLDRDPCLTREHSSHQSLGPKFGGDTLNNHRLTCLKTGEETETKTQNTYPTKKIPEICPET